MNANVNENVLVNEVNNNVENTAKVEKKKAQKTTAKKSTKKESAKVEKKKVEKTTAKKSTKKESAKVEKKEIEKLSFSKLLDTTGLHTNSGLKKENLYNSSIYADCLTDKDKKSVRRKIRSLLDNFIGSIIRSEKNKTICENHCKQFKLFYEQVYRINDFSVESLISNNTDELKKENLKKMLEIVKKNLK
jgi:mannitol-specific phosphotransferase system IIBC component